MGLTLAIATVLATLFSPIIAIRAQKYLEKNQKNKQQKLKYSLSLWLNAQFPPAYSQNIFKH